MCTGNMCGLCVGHNLVEVRWFEPGLCRRAVFSDEKLYSTQSSSTQVYKLVLATVREALNKMLGVTQQWTSIPSSFQGRVVVILVTSCYSD